MPPKKTDDPNELMIVNDAPGEECRIAIVANNHLEELYTERTATATNVGNIYKGRVTNVEPAIQAAFIDYGEGANGFLHISDLHPKYFPGQERTERVGRKIPRRERPPIQEALRRGEEILVQVLKEGIGTKGPTLTSYLSIPGRLLVAMPDMDRVGVSRKVEDEQKRREMREILDSLDLPDGFGFILRTAGFGRSKTELKRDASYLMRLWKVMEKRIKKVGAPCELYRESDLLIRTIRDVVRPTIKAIIVDSASAFDRVSAFLRVVSPRNAPKVIHYRRPTPIFHAFDIERQIELIHSREVPLPSGGRLVIDQTEALVAIDVNSGKSRSARDSETNAYETNCEAADEICRQLRLRDLGGLIVHDLIDMRFAKHRKQIEERFTSNLKRDRAKSTILSISEFGILEMTRQRMRPSMRKAHFMACPHCNGNGEIKVPESVAGDAVRHVGFLLQYDRIQRLEMVCSPRVASVLLSGKRREIVRLEDSTGKRVDVRVSDAIAVDRVDFYAYDHRNADIDISKLPPLNPPGVEALEAEAAKPLAATDQIVPPQAGRGERAHGPADAEDMALDGEFDSEDFPLEDEALADEVADGAVEPSGAPASARPEFGRMDSGKRRRRRGRRGRGQGENGQQQHRISHPQAQPQPQPAQGDGQGRRGRRRRGRRGRGEHPPQQQHGAMPRQQAPGSESAPGAPAAEVAGFSQDQPNAEHPVRVHELARELQVSSKELIERCEPDPAIHPINSPLASVTPNEAQAIREMFSNGAPPEGGDSHSPQALPVLVAAEDRTRRRRRGRRGRGRGQHNAGQASGAAPSPAAPSAGVTPTPSQQPSGASHEGQPAGGRKRRRRRRGRGGGGAQAAAQASAQPGDVPALTESAVAPAVSAAGQPKNQPHAKKRRALYRAGRVSVSPKAVEGGGTDYDE